MSWFWQVSFRCNKLRSSLWCGCKQKGANWVNKPRGLGGERGFFCCRGVDGERGEWGAFRMRFTVGCLSPLHQAWRCRRNQQGSQGRRVAVPGCGALWDALERRGCRGGGCALCQGPQERRGRRVPAWKGAFLRLSTQADAYPAEAVKQGRAAARLADSCPVICQPQGDARAGRLQLTSHFHLRNKR